MKRPSHGDKTPTPEAEPVGKYVIGDRNALDVAADHGVPAQTFYQRVFLGWSVERAASTPVRQYTQDPERDKAEGQPRRPHIHRLPDGRPALDVAREHGISRGLLYGRLRLGWNLERAATHPVGVDDAPRREKPARAPASKRNYVIGERSAVIVAAEHGISREVFYQRMHRGWDVGRAATEPRTPVRRRKA